MSLAKNKLICIFLIFAFLFQVIVPDASACWWKGLPSQNPDIGGAPPAQGGLDDGKPNQPDDIADNVFLHNGDFVYTHQDLFIPSRGLNIELIRTYKSQSRFNGRFGLGWELNYNQRLVLLSDGSVFYLDGEGKRHHFLYLDGKNFISPAELFDKLVQNTDGTYTLTKKDATKYNFNSNGTLAEIVDPNNNKLTFGYHPEGKLPIIGVPLYTNDPKTARLIAYQYLLTKITDTTGREIALSYDANGRLTKIADFSGRTIDYTYDDFGHLTSVTDPAGNTTQYTYDSDRNLRSITDPKGNTFLTNTYNPLDQVIAQTYGNDTFYFSYDTENRITQFTDRKGNTWTYYLDKNGNPIKIVDPKGNTTLKTYDTNNKMLLTSVTYPKGNSIEYSYDDKGNLLEIRRKPNPQTTPLPADIVTTFTYESHFNFIKTLKDPKANTTTYYYDYEEATLGDLNGDGITDQSNGNLVKITYPAVGAQTPETKFTYNPYGQVLSVADPNANVTQYEYYPTTGYLAKVINAKGSLDLTTEMTYDTVGNALSIKDPKANTTTFQYDSHNNLLKTISSAPLNYETKYKYDANDNLAQVDRQTGNPDNPWQTTYYTYDALDRLETIKDELTNLTTFGYDKNGNRNLIKDAELNTTNYEYDERNLLWKVTDAEGNTTEYTYDLNGNLKEIKDAKANKTLYDYDDFDRLITTTYQDGSKEEYTYDVNSNLKTKKDPKNQTIYYDYDALSRLIEMGLSPKGTDPNSVVTYTYDKGSRLIDVVDSTGTIHYNYDSANRITQVTYPGAKSISYEYDSNSNRTKLVYPDTTYITYNYDSLNRLTYIKDQAGSPIASYQYDALSRRTQTDLANDTQTTYQYDTINRLTKLKGLSPQGTVPEFSYTYDNVGNRKTMTTQAGTHNYTYDKIYQLTIADYPAGYAVPDTTFNYDKVGNRISTVNGGTTNYTSNNLNQYSKVSATDYTHDANGNLTSDGSNTYTYDYENRLSAGTVPARGLSLSYKYDPFGRRIQKNVDGAITNYIYDGDQVIAEYDGSGNLITKFVYGSGIDEPVKGLSPQGTVPEWFYHYDGLGSVTNLTNSSGATLETYSYDAFGKPNTTSTIGNRFMFTGREYDEETGLYYYRSRYYSPTLGRFLQRDPVGYFMGLNLYTYCGNSPNNWVDPLGLMAAGYTGWGTNPKDPKNAIKQISEKVKKSGIESKTYSYHSWEINKSIGEILKYVDKNGDGKITDKENEMASVELYGHSLGGRAAIEVAQRLNEKGIDIDVLILVDLINGSGEKIPSNVQHLINIRQTVPPLSGQQPIVNSIPYENINMGKMGHAEIINNPSVKKYIENYILATEGLPIDL